MQRDVSVKASHTEGRADALRKQSVHEWRIFQPSPCVVEQSPGRPVTRVSAGFMAGSGLFNIAEGIILIFVACTTLRRFFFLLLALSTQARLR